jgi:hypothetical protein
MVVGGVSVELNAADGGRCRCTVVTIVAAVTVAGVASGLTIGQHGFTSIKKLAYGRSIASAHPISIT